MVVVSNSSGKTRLVTMRFSIMYETPDGTRRLSSSTYSVPSRSRTRSEPQTCAQHAAFRLHARALRPVVLRIGQQLLRKDAVPDDLLIGVDVPDEAVERRHALL